MNYVTLWSIGVICIALQGCATNTINMEIVHRSIQCNGEQPGLMALKDRSTFEQMITKQSPFAGTQDASGPAESDFQDKHVILVAMGQQPTAGYRLQVTDDTATVTGDALYLPIQFKNPDGDMQAQMVTSPCLVISLDKGTYRVVRVGNYSLSL